MTESEFMTVLNRRIELIKEVLGKKAAEYARSGDRLSNFKRAAAYLRCTPERANLGANSKHLVSIADMVDDLEKGQHHPVAMWEEKLGDAINYLILMEAQVKERIGKRNWKVVESDDVRQGMEGL